MIGLASTTAAIDIAQAAMESVGYRFAAIFDRLSEVAAIKEIYASGGAFCGSSIWTQIIADILGRRLTLVDVPEASLRGAVLLALETLGNIETIEEISPGRGRVFEPRLDRKGAYQDARDRHDRLYDLIINNQ